METLWNENGRDLPSHVLLYGGMMSTSSWDMPRDACVYVLELKTMHWRRMECSNPWNEGIYAHKTCVARDSKGRSRYLIVHGGIVADDKCDLMYNEKIAILDLMKYEWRCIEDRCLEDVMCVGHDIFCVSQNDSKDDEWNVQMTIVGGGITVFSFGVVYNTAVSLTITL